MSIAEKLTTIAENQQRVFDAGMSKAESDFWDSLQNYGERENYEHAFANSGFEYIRPKHKVIPTSRSVSMFNDNSVLKKVESQYFDLSKCSINDSSTGGNYGTFSGCRALEEIEDIGMQAGYYNSTFRSCENLHTIAIVRFEIETKINSSVFTGCYELQNITIAGTIGAAISLANSPKLTTASVQSIIDHLADLTGQTAQKISFHTDVILSLTAEQADAIAAKNWTI